MFGSMMMSQPVMIVTEKFIYVIYLGQLSKIDAEKNQQNLEEAEARLKQLQQTYDLKRAAAQSATRNEIECQLGPFLRR